LYYRLNVLPVRVPALRERASDVQDLVQYFAGRHAVKGTAPVKLDFEFLEVLKGYSWPGNVRELSNLVNRFSALFPGQLLRLRNISPEMLPRKLRELPRTVLEAAARHRELAVTVHAGDGLEEVMLREGLADIEGGVSVAVKAREQLARDNHDLEWIGWVTESIEQLFLIVFVADVSLPFRFVMLGTAHDDGAGVGTKQLIHHLFVQHTAFAIENHHLGLKPIGLDFGLVVANHMLDDGSYPFWILYQYSHFGGTLRQVVSILLAQISSNLLVGLIDRRAIDFELHRGGFEVQW
jgi:hypothetical protein